MELFSAFDHAVASTAEIVKATKADQLGAATPCLDWDVRDLLNHIVGALWLAEGMFGDQLPRHQMAPGSLPATDLIGDDPAAAYAEAATAALAATAGDALTRMHVTPLGEMPGPLLAGFTTLDIVVHGWDLAVATGQPADLDGRLAAHVLAFAEQSYATKESRGDGIGPALPVAADASVTERLTAYLGRKA
jgi:uncharacterized protein (TIGR03086 family)